MTPLIAGNWKMNGLNAELSEIRVIVDGLSPTSDVSAMICPPALILQAAAEIAGCKALCDLADHQGAGGLVAVDRGRDAQGRAVALLACDLMQEEGELGAVGEVRDGDPMHGHGGQPLASLAARSAAAPSAIFWRMPRRLAGSTSPARMRSWLAG